MLLKLHRTVQFVGLLTGTFRDRSQRLSPAFSGMHPMTHFRDKGDRLRTYSTAVQPPCSGFAPDSLVQQNKNACPLPWLRVAHLPQSKPGFLSVPPAGGCSLCQCRLRSQMRRHRGNLLAEGGSSVSVIKGLRKGDRANQIRLMNQTAALSFWQPAVPCAASPAAAFLLSAGDRLLFGAPLQRYSGQSFFAD